MSNYKKFTLFCLLLFLSGCGSIKEGFSNQKKNSSDEFLVEKKTPLVMPPNFNELPTPKVDETIKNIEKNEVKKLLSNNENLEPSSNSLKTINKTLEESILEKIKNN
ncbi:DUF3035 domain-containing protein [Candidatus Pelagibacter sp.]|nr:DUF3035 domain-containing protein [Candidatus Pelagibacter sp.]